MSAGATLQGEPIVLPASLRDRLLAVVREHHPQKSFGYLLSATGPTRPTDFVRFAATFATARTGEASSSRSVATSSTTPTPAS